ncbi:MAG TPA: ParB/RepB/Spo0J family partition protein [Balneolales bacterium]|nr:ParB/RepB/Spo0J family partition protein [Balneolales bacterium]
MAKRKALGRGLGAYFPDMEEKDEKKAGDSSGGGNPYIETGERINVILHIPVTNVRPNPNQPRKEFDELKLQELAESIQQHGLIQPITVRYVGEKRYELISGERRLRAARMAGFHDIPAYIREIDDEQSLAFALIENVQREELNPIEIAMGYRRLIDECSYTQDEVSKKVGKSRSAVTNFLRLLNLPALIQRALRDGKISTGHARALITIEDPQLQQQILDKAIAEDYSVRQIEDAVRRIAKKKSRKRTVISEKDQNDFETNELARQLRHKLSTKVQIKKKNEGGEIRIEYYSDEDLDRLISVFDSL